MMGAILMLHTKCLNKAHWNLLDIFWRNMSPPTSIQLQTSLLHFSFATSVAAQTESQAQRSAFNKLSWTRKCIEMRPTGNSSELGGPLGAPQRRFLWNHELVFLLPGHGEVWWTSLLKPLPNINMYHKRKVGYESQAKSGSNTPGWVTISQKRCHIQICMHSTSYN